MEAVRSILTFFKRQIDKHERATVTVLAIIIGVLAGYGAILFRILIDVIATAQIGTSNQILAAIESLDWWQRIFPPVFGLVLSAAMVHWLAKETAGSGIPQVMESIAIRGGHIRKRVAAVKLLATALTLGSGGSAGREGPIVQVGGATGSLIGQWIKASYRRQRILVACGAAGALAATFNAPIAGVLFSLEILISEFSAISLSPIVIASVMGTVVSRAHLGNSPAFAIPQELMSFHFSSAWEIGTFLLLGLVAGALGLIFSHSVFTVDDWFRKITVPVWMKWLAGAILVGFFIAFIPNVASIGYDTIDGLLKEDIGSITPSSSLMTIIENPFLFVLVLFVMKVIATSFTLGMGASGGIFAPSLFMGAAVGYGFGFALNVVMQDLVSSPGMYALVGMGAFVAGVTHTPMTSIIIIFEMTGDYVIILPLMLACMFSTLLATRLHPESIFTRRLAQRGINVSAGKEEQVLRSISVGTVMSVDFDVIPQRMEYGDIVRLVTTSRGIYFPVLDDDNKMIGIIRYYDLREHLFDRELEHLVIAHDLVVRDVVTLLPGDSLLTAFELLTREDIEQIPVVDPDDTATVVGMLSRRDLLNAYNKAVLQKGLDIEAVR